MQSLKQSVPKEVESEYETFFKAELLLKQLSPKNKTEEGRSIEVNAVHSEKQNESIKITEFGIDTDFKFVHFMNDLSPNV
jgi:hypothetical protein